MSKKVIVYSTPPRYCLRLKSFLKESRIEFENNVKSDAPEEKLKRILVKAVDICPVGLIFEKVGINIETELITEGL